MNRLLTITIISTILIYNFAFAEDEKNKILPKPINYEQVLKNIKQYSLASPEEKKILIHYFGQNKADVLPTLHWVVHDQDIDTIIASCNILKELKEETETSNKILLLAQPRLNIATSLNICVYIHKKSNPFATAYPLLLLKKKDPIYSILAAKSLEKMGDKKAVFKIYEIIQTCGEEKLLRNILLNAIANAKTENALLLLEQLVQEKIGIIRTEATEAIGQWLIDNDKSPAGVKYLYSILNNNSESLEVRIAASNALSKVNSNAVIIDLINLLSSSDESIKNLSINSLIKNTHAYNHLIFNMLSTNLKMRRTITEMFSKNDPPDKKIRDNLIAPLKELLGDPDQIVRYNAVVGLCRIQKVSTMEPLSHFLGSDNPNEQKAVRNLIFKITGHLFEKEKDFKTWWMENKDKTREEWLIDAISNSTDTLTIEHCLKIFGVIKSTKSVKYICKIIETTSDEKIIFSSIIALGHIANQEATEYLIKILESNKQGHPDAAAQQLRFIASEYFGFSEKLETSQKMKAIAYWKFWYEKNKNKLKK